MRAHVFLLATCCSGLTCASTPGAGLPLPDAQVAALAGEVNGDTAKRNLEGIVQFHRQRGSRGFHSAAEIVAERAKAYGLSGVEILQFPTDGKIFYGTQRSRMGWDADKGELTEVRDGKELPVASFAAMPVALAEDSESADVVAELVDVGDGDKESDYAGKDLKDKIVLVAQQPSGAEALAIGRFGAVGMVSYASNQTTAWSGENQEQVRWGHLDSFSPHKTFAFMVSQGAGKAYKSRLAAHETIRLHASVQAGQHSSHYDIVTAIIPGADPALANEEIAYGCHLDHQRPGANDNASGCATILEVARTLQALIASGKLARPARTLRFIWPPEVEGTTTLLNARPDFAQHIKAVVHMDMVGGGPQTQAVFHVTRGPASLPSPIHDIAWSFASWVNAQTYRYAATGKSDFPMVAPSGGKEPLRAEDSPFDMGGDHEVYQDASFGIPAIYFNDWPDRYIHTNLDRAENIDATKLQRAAFIGAASGYVLARDGVPRSTPPAAAPGPAGDGDGLLVFRRVAAPRGPLSVFGYDYFDDHAKEAGLPRPKLLDFEGTRVGGGYYAYEARNFADGHRSAQQIANELSAEFSAVPVAVVVEYLKALEAVGLLERVH
ncbi:MAG TPA: M28 family metallopeptidase [Rudaea sp.]|nr:M28 family metallopeptidase [Rudaea sp.]HSC11407.1 M28 family metallopeptidase [Rhodanobacteraceae bacterium]